MAVDPFYKNIVGFIITCNIIVLTRPTAQICILIARPKAQKLPQLVNTLLSHAYVSKSMLILEDFFAVNFLKLLKLCTSLLWNQKENIRGLWFNNVRTSQ